jgi:hypothetical protein
LSHIRHQAAALLAQTRKRHKPDKQPEGTPTSKMKITQ